LKILYYAISKARPIGGHRQSTAARTLSSLS
jgi:hypothetical protein